MGDLIRHKDILEIGGFLNHWFEARINNNQNVLLVITGPTGSSKSYDSLSGGETWYKYKFKEEFPIDNVCFSLGTLAKRITELSKSGKLRKGEYFIIEESGNSLGNLDFQNRISKMFSYILQSFRSLNLIVVMNLPVLTMMNKTARQLIHGHFVTAGIDRENNIAKVKPYLHQLSQLNGKSYWKYPRVKINNKVVTLQRLKFVKPSDSLLVKYEERKKKYVVNLTEEFIEMIEKEDKEKLFKIAMSRKGISERESQYLDMLKSGMTKEDIAKKQNCTLTNVLQILSNAKKKGYDWKKYVKNERLSSINNVVVNAP